MIFNNTVTWEDKARPIVTLSFDDGYKDTLYNTLPLLKKYNFVATYNIIAGLIDKKFEGRKLISGSDILRASELDMEITSHSLTHKPLVMGGRAGKYLKSFPHRQNKLRYLLKAISSFSGLAKSVSKPIATPEIYEEIIKSKEKLIQLGVPVESFIYPGGAYNDEITKLIEGNYSSARSTDTGINSPHATHLYRLKIFAWDKWTNVSVANKWIAKAISEKFWLIETFHLISDTNPKNYEYFTYVKNFDAHLHYLKSKNIWVATQKQAVEFIK